MPKMKILFIAYDNESFLTTFPLGIAYLTSVLRKNGCEVSIYSQDAYHWPEDHLVNYLKKNYFDLIGVGVIGGYYQYKKLLKISQAINSIPNRRFFYVIGGHGPSPEPEFFLHKTGADAVVMGEGEVVMSNLVEALESDGNLAAVKGIAYRDGDKVIINEREKLIEDVDSIPWPAWDLFPMDYYTMMRAPGIRLTERSQMVFTGRGCPFKCNFCYRMDPGFRPRSAENIIEEMRILKRDYYVTFFEFQDDLFMVNKKRTMEFCEKLIRANLGIRFTCNGRLNYGTREILRTMKKAGCVFINYGIEALDDTVLENMNKKLTVEQIITGVENTIAEGIHPGLNVIWGNIGDNAETLRKGVDFIIKYTTYAQLRTIRPVTPYPGSPLYYYAIEQGLLEGPEDFYERKHVNSDLFTVNFTEHSGEECYQLLYEANKRLINDYINHQKQSYMKQLRELYVEKDTSFRGFRHT
jgi:anaerobic magnesium-protoporphyrin IX monomethyl ester cyclase